MLRRNWRMAFIIFSKFLPGRRAIRTVFCFITAISAIFIGLATIPARANAKVHNKLGGGGYDGPAELPIATVASSMADTQPPALSSTSSLAATCSPPLTMPNAETQLNYKPDRRLPAPSSFQPRNVTVSIGSLFAPAWLIAVFRRSASGLRLVSREWHRC
jgi:hypothetical protein